MSGFLSERERAQVKIMNRGFNNLEARTVIEQNLLDENGNPTVRPGFTKMNNYKFERLESTRLFIEDKELELEYTKRNLEKLMWKLSSNPDLLKDIEEKLEINGVCDILKKALYVIIDDEMDLKRAKRVCTNRLSKIYPVKKTDINDEDEFKKKYGYSFLPRDMIKDFIASGDAAWKVDIPKNHYASEHSASNSFYQAIRNLKLTKVVRFTRKDGGYYLIRRKNPAINQMSELITDLAMMHASKEVLADAIEMSKKVIDENRKE